MPRRLIFISALLLILSYPPFDFGWLAWVALVPWLISIEQATPRQAFRRGYAVGLLFFGGTIWWLIHVTFIGTILLVAYLALFFAFWGWSARRFSSVLALPAAWVISEYLRSTLLTGFGWNLLGHTQWRFIPMIQIADATGVYGVSFLVALVNAALYLAYRRQGNKARVLGIALLALLTAMTYGFVRLHQLDSRYATGDSRESFKVAVLQGSIPQTQKWDEAFAESIWKRYEELTRRAAQEKPNLIIWPETAVPGYLEEERVTRRLAGIAQTASVPLLAGAPAGEITSTRVFNSAVLIDSHGKIEESYEKVHLVPFGEYVPLGPLFSWLRNFVLMGDFSSGHEFTVFHPLNHMPPFGVLICFEDLFPELSRRFVKAGAQWLIVITNDAWFGQSAASLQHLQASVFRAVENRVWVVRAANTGFSGFIDPAGRVLKTQVPRFRPGLATAQIKGTE